MDAFARLGLPRRPDLTDESLREAFREAGKSSHPDAGGGKGDFQLLQEAYQLLSRPSRRLKHWLELSGIPGDERGALGPDLMDHFSRISEVLQEADALIRKRENARSSLAKAMLEGETNRVRMRIDSAQSLLGEAVGAKVAMFGDLTGGDNVDPWQLVRDLAFLEKWQAQLRERFGKLW